MPAFPSYRGTTPKCLNPLNPYHYLLLAYWLFFRPSGFSAYLNQAEPKQKMQEGWAKFSGTLRTKACRQIYIMAIASSLLCLILAVSITFFYNLGTFQGHTGSINAVAAVSSQRAISASAFSASKPGTLKVWDLERGKVLSTLEGHTRGVNALAVTPDGKQAISVSGDRSLRVWDLDKGTAVSTLWGHKRWVNDVAIAPNGKYAISASADGTVKVWDIESGKVRHTLEGHGKTVNRAIVTPDGQTAISASDDNTLKVWDIESGQERATLKGHSASIKILAALPERRVISGSTDGTVKVWDWQRGKLLYNLSGHQNPILDLAATADGERAVSASADGTLKVWDLESGKELHSLAGHTGWVNAVALTPDGKRAISASSDRSLKVWDIEKGTELYTLEGHGEWVRDVAVTPDGKRAFSGSGDRQVKLWDLETGREIPLTTATNVLLLSQWAFGISSLLLLIATLFEIAILLAVAFMAFGAAGSIGLLLILFAVGCIPFAWAVVGADVIAINPYFKKAFGVIAIQPNIIIFAVGIILGLVVNTAFSLAGQQALGAFASLVAIALLGLAVGAIQAGLWSHAQPITRLRLKGGIKTAISISLFFNLPVAIGALRSLFYPVELVLSFYATSRGKGHPVEWDELAILPLWGTREYLYRRLQQDEKEGLRSCAIAARNPFQRIAVRQALHKYLHSTPMPIHFLYTLLTWEDLGLSVPAAGQNGRELPSTGRLLLAELDKRSRPYNYNGANQTIDRLVIAFISVTWFWRDRRRTALTTFAGILYDLSDETKITNGKNNEHRDDFNLASYHPHLAKLSSYTGGEEIIISFEAMATFLSYRQLADLAEAVAIVSKLPLADTAIRPQVMNAINCLGEVGSYINGYIKGDRAGASPAIQLAALTRATNILDELTFKQPTLDRPALDEATLERPTLDETNPSTAGAIGSPIYGGAQTNSNVNTSPLPAPERAILQQVIHQWRFLVSRSAAKIANEI
ncbi:MAG: hypothetical protein F6J93_08330 [Oscillatoria sp. SIO1A7]|nr:hypothetical protein [Oscillatoria sp. SIO1A7]